MTENVKLKGEVVAYKHNQLVIDITDDEVESYSFENGLEVEIEFTSGIEKYEDEDDEY